MIIPTSDMEKLVSFIKYLSLDIAICLWTDTTPLGWCLGDPLKSAFKHMSTNEHQCKRWEMRLRPY